MEIEIRWIDDAELRRSAAVFLQQHRIADKLPIPIELVIEQIGIDIVPVHNLQVDFDMVGCVSADMTTIFVDLDVSEKRENRYRFTLAHELAHVILHRELLQRLRKGARTIEAWVELNGQMAGNTGASIEYQANMFAGLVLVPPAPLAVACTELVPELKNKVIEASKGAAPAEARKYALAMLVDEIGDLFQVSTQVVEKRLDYDGYTAATLFA